MKEENKVMQNAGDLSEELKTIATISNMAENVENELTKTVSCGSFMTIYCC